MNKGILRLATAALSLALAGPLAACGASPSAWGALRGIGRTGALAVGDSGLQLYTMPDDGAAPLLDAIQGAQKSIHLELYMLTTTNASGDLMQALIDKAKAGLDVRVMLDPHPYIPASAPKCQPSTMNINAKAFKALTAAGVMIKASNPRFVYTHEKGMVIDGTTAYIMTCNWTTSAFKKNREYVVADQNPQDVAEVDAIFEADWQSQPIAPSDPALVVSPDNSRAKILSLIDTATRSIALESEVFTDPEVASHIAAKVQAGVDVKALLAFERPTSCGDDLDGQETQIMQSSGITAFAFPKRLVMHAKAIVVDGTRAYVGSENFSENSLDHNREMGLLVDDPAIVSALARTVATDWTNNAGAQRVMPVISTDPVD